MIAESETTTLITKSDQQEMRLFDTEQRAQDWVRECLTARRYNYFTGFRNNDSSGRGHTWGISAGWAHWAGEKPYIRDIFPHIIHDDPISDQRYNNDLNYSKED